MGASGRAGRMVAGLFAAGVLAGCADPGAEGGATASASPPAPVRVPIQHFLPDNEIAPGVPAPPPPPATEAGEAAEPVRVNDPSAPPDTPLCGRAAREAIADAAAVSPAVEAGAGACAATACFDPLTDTYIGADGSRHVCQE